MLTRENEGSKKSVRKVVQDFVHQQYEKAAQSKWRSPEDNQPRCGSCDFHTVLNSY